MSRYFVVTAKWGAPIEERKVPTARTRSTDPATPPSRIVLRLAGIFTQLACAGCLLLGTIAFVLIQQNKSGGSGWAIGWGLTAMTGLVFGGLMVRGGLIALLGAALIDIGFGSVLLVIDKDALAGMLRILSADDVGMIADALFAGAIALVVLGVLCFAAIPQAIRYSRWLHASESGEFRETAASTNKGFPPPPISASKSSMWLVPAAPPAERRSRRRMYFALGGFAIGFGAGIGVLVSSTTTRSRDSGESVVVDAGSAKKPDKPDKPDKPRDKPIVVPADAGVASTDKPPPPPDKPAASVQTMLQEQHDAMARGDIAGVLATLSSSVAGFGVDADELVEGKPAIEAQLKRDLGEFKRGTVDVKSSRVGQEGTHAWIAEDLELRAAGKVRVFSITQLAVTTNGKWQTVAWHWAVLVRDDVAERLALLGRKPSPKAIPNKLDGPKDLDAAVRAAFASRKAFGDARSDREDGLNQGSGPGERILGGAKIKYVFDRLRAEIKLHDGAHVVAVSPTVAFALVNADFTHKTRAATDMTITFRVLAVLLKESSGWKLVQTQWSHGGPIR